MEVRLKCRKDEDEDEDKDEDEDEDEDEQLREKKIMKFWMKSYEWINAYLYEETFWCEES